MQAAKMSPQFQHVLAWADEYKRLGVYANADTPEDAQKARDFGAEGIGLCRTEHMFMQTERLPVVQEMIMAETPDSRRKCLEQLLPMQRDDFHGILKAMKGLPVTIRLLDPPLHEFLPSLEDLLVETTELRVSKSRSVAAREEGQGPAARARAAREQSDARPTRLPARHRLSGDLPDAGARHHGGRGRSSRKRRSTRARSS